MKVFEVKTDRKTIKLMYFLEYIFNKKSRAEVFCLAIALLKACRDELKKGHKIAVVDKHDNIIQEVHFPDFHQNDAA